MILAYLSVFASVLGIDPTMAPEPGELPAPPSVMIGGQQAVLSTGTRRSENHIFSLSARPDLHPMRLNTLHSWTLDLLDDAGQPVSDARITVTGGMPQHAHGLPTAPQVSRREAPGQYVLEGVRFNMTGWWQLDFAIERENRSDHVRFNFIVPDSTGK